MRKSALRIPSAPRPLPALILSVLTILLVGRHPVYGQEPTIAVDVKVVNVLATVRDKHGQIVNSLTKDDFTLQEDGHAETIKYFSRESDLPLTLGLLVDTSLSQRRVLGEERSASYSFLEKMLRPKDQAFVIHFDHEAELLQDLTSSKEKLQTALDKLESPERPALSRGGGSGGSGRSGGGGWPGSGGGGGHGRGHGGGGGAGTVLYDAAYLASDELMKPQKGRKALIVLTDGVDRGSKETLDAAMEAAQRADTVVYSILFKDDEAYNNGGGFGGMGRMGRGGGRRYPQESRPDGKKIMERICQETGGRLFEVSKKQPIDKIYIELQEELRNQYNLGYTPAKNNEATGYRKIALTTKQKDLKVQARDGYYADR
jgi:VWFA-related protein